MEDKHGEIQLIFWDVFKILGELLKTQKKISLLLCKSLSVSK